MKANENAYPKSGVILDSVKNLGFRFFGPELFIKPPKMSKKGTLWEYIKCVQNYYITLSHFQKVQCVPISTLDPELWVIGPGQTDAAQYIEPKFSKFDFFKKAALGPGFLWGCQRRLRKLQNFLNFMLF